jgi:hypothetical protein
MPVIYYWHFFYLFLKNEATLDQNPLDNKKDVPKLHLGYSQHRK